MTPREQVYFDFFLDGNVSLDYLKKIKVRDVILKSDKGKMLDLFPNFLVLPTDYQEDQFDSSYYKLPADAIKTAINNVVVFIEGSLFSQDIATLNNLAKSFEQSIAINEASKLKLQEEQTKLNQITADLEVTLAEAKKIYTTYDILSKGFETRGDPVLAYQKEVQQKYEEKLAKDSYTQAELIKQKNQQEIIKKASDDLAAALIEAQKLNFQKTSEDVKAAEIAHEKAVKDAIEAEAKAKEGFAVNSTTPKPVVTSSKKSLVAPLAVGAGLLAMFFVGKGE